MRLPIMKLIAVLTALVSPAQSAFASDQTGAVTAISWASGRFFFSLNGARTGVIPSCSCCNRWEVTSTTDAGRTLIAMILTAQGTGKSVVIEGTSACVAGSADTEGVTYGQVLS